MRAQGLLDWEGKGSDWSEWEAWGIGMTGSGLLVLRVAYAYS